jgi:hypothetical protein
MSENPSLHTYSEWSAMFSSIGKGMPMPESVYNDLIRDTKQDSQSPLFDEYGNQVNPEWVEMLVKEGVKLYTRQEADERRLNAYIGNTSAKRQAEENKLSDIIPPSTQSADFVQMYDLRGNLIPSDMISELRALDYPMFTQEELKARYRESLLEEARILKNGRNNVDQPIPPAEDPNMLSK